MWRIRGVAPVSGKAAGVVLIYNGTGSAILRSDKFFCDIPLNKEEIAELAKVFRNCIDLWDSKAEERR